MRHDLVLDNYTQTTLAKVASIPGELVLYSFTVHNTNAAAQFILLFDDGYKNPPNTTVPSATFTVAAHSTLEVAYTVAGRLCKGGVSIANSSTAAALTAGAADCLFDIQYAHRFEED